MRSRSRLLLAVSVLVIVSVAALALYALPAATDSPPGVGGIDRGTEAPDLQVAAADLSTSVAPPRPELQPITIPTRPTDPALSDTPAVPPDMPVSEMLDLLGERARRGDAVAACELGRALGECRMRPHMMRMGAMPPPPPNAERATVDRFVETEARREEWRTRLDQRCDGLPSGALSEALAFNARAALAGHVPSLMDFLNGPMSAPADFIRDPQFAQLYRTHGWPLLRRALAQRDFPASMAMFMQLSRVPGGGPLAAIVPEQYQDPDAARALLRQLTGQPMPMPGMPVEPETPPSSEALATAERWIDELFDGQLPEGGMTMGSAGMPMPGRFTSRCRDADAWLDAARS